MKVDPWEFPSHLVSGTGDSDPTGGLAGQSDTKERYASDTCSQEKEQSEVVEICVDRSISPRE
ncbi:hypothetical protein AN958_11860 [Leucoagaricus sp. SymC.cos]|nr:hypothetical protein AN958_11860 [Leucoagaricus sp. SymC.cos]